MATSETTVESGLSAQEQIRRELLIHWLRKTRRRRRTLSTLLMRGWSR